MSGRLIQLFRPLKHKNPSTGDDFINSSGIIFLVPILANKETLAPLAPGPIIWGRSLRSFRHLECQNLSIISDSIGIFNGSKKCGKSEESRNLIHIEEDRCKQILNCRFPFTDINHSQLGTYSLDLIYKSLVDLFHSSGSHSLIQLEVASPWSRCLPTSCLWKVRSMK